MRKRDMYINRNKSSYKGFYNHNGKGKRKGMFVAVTAMVLIVVLALSTFYFTKGRFLIQEEARKTRQENSQNHNNANFNGNNTLSTEEKNDQSANSQNNVSKIASKEGQTENNLQSKTTNSRNTQDGNSQGGNSQDGNTQDKNTQDGNTQNGVLPYDNNNNQNNIPSSTGADGNTTDMQEVFQNGTARTRLPRKVKGIYVTGPRAGKESYMKDLIELVDTTELNAMVIDIKNDNGEITYKMDLPQVKDMGADVNYISNIEQLIADLKAKDIYLIARIVAFKDPILAKNRPDLSLKKKDGSIFYDKSGLSWVNPYKKEVWEYLVSVAKEAALLGFDEIQFDYIRFSTDSGMKEVNFGKEAKGKSKMETITEFTKYACENLKPLGVYVSADVYGTIIDSKVDAKIVGQDYKEMAKYLDYICPMIYPSHYQDGSYGIKHPDLNPYDLILSALDKSQTELKESDNTNQAIVRSWLQDFTATWLDNHKSYGPKEIRDQIKAVYDAGYDEWILWNGNNNYTKEGLEKE
ncbi:putative glycoside hydrolase [Anaerocolumna sp. AGMB13025]|uniref:putative glycoside hydrolase n=1 Tax=Anaerocolumna sp. AGMB13025 TaxID=3039116 RepID=UPI00241C262B|nr:putative glycoside hydrolase [Anaerocolumna sp. AGMB13025]WFR58405.1 putative glycoside hydrolase [Anaerocolumna sp. AGMB13025]